VLQPAAYSKGRHFWIAALPPVRAWNHGKANMGGAARRPRLASVEFAIRDTTPRHPAPDLRHTGSLCAQAHRYSPAAYPRDQDAWATFLLWNRTDPELRSCGAVRPGTLPLPASAGTQRDSLRQHPAFGSLPIRLRRMIVAECADLRGRKLQQR
jgi:hypothetical protein